MGARLTRRPHVPAAWLRSGPRRRPRARRDPRAAGHGVRGARRAARRSPGSTRRSPASSGYAIFGPSRVLVLGPGLVGLAADLRRDRPAARVPGDPCDRDRARRHAGPARRRSSRSRIGLGKLGFVADLLSSEVQVGYMNGLAITIIVGQLPKLCGFSTDADGFVRARSTAFVRASRRDEGRRARRRRRGARRPARAPHGHDAESRRCSSPWSGATVVSAVLGLSDHESRPSAPCRAGSRRRRSRGRRSTTSGRCSSPRSASRSSRSPTRSRPSASFAARRGDERRPEPGDDRPRRREHRRRVLPGLRGVDERLAHRRRRAVRAPRASSPDSSARVSSSRSCCCSSTRCSPTSRSRRSPRW